MLLGEYAVLQGGPALVCAVDKRITVTLKPRTDRNIQIDSSTHGTHHTTLDDIQVEKPFQFVLATLKHFQSRMRHGCDIEITTDFSDKIGFGSSSAVTVATIAVLVTWLGIRVTPHDLLRQGRTIIRSVQGVGSGADVAASVYGGMVAYQSQPLAAEKIDTTYPICALYSGFKTTTPDAISHVQNRFAAFPDLYKQFCQTIGQCAYKGIQLARKADWPGLGEIMSMQQGLMASLGVSLPLLAQMVHDLKQQPAIHGAKISGSGLGDCVVGLGELPKEYVGSCIAEGVQQIPVSMTLQGVQCDKY
jgi:mevalonate kinase